MTVANQLVVPITLWGNKAPTHCISGIYFTRDQKTIVTGSNDGHICVWDVGSQLKTTPRCLLFGHTAPVLCFTYGSIAADSTLLVSSSEAGEMSVWDLTDGRCLESTKLSYVHTTIVAYHMSSVNDIRLFCNGYYAEILVMDVLTLDVLFTLSSRVTSDWISAIHVLRPVKRQDDVIVALSAAGLVKVWTLNGSESKNEPIYEDESKPIKCFNALRLTCCAYNQRTALIICAKYWQIYDAGDFSLLCSYDNPVNERWMGGDFIAADRVLTWTDGGKGYLYKLPTNCNASCKDFHTAAKQSDQPFLFCTLTYTDDKRLLHPPAMNYFLTTREHYQKLLLRGDSSGRVIVWHVPDISEKDLEKMKQEKNSKPVEIKPITALSLQEAWDSMHPSPAGILDQMLNTPESPGLKLTASVYLPLQGRLVCGREDGSIIIISGTQTVLLQLMYGKHQTYEDWPPHQLLHGHSGRVSCLIYPHHVHNRYDVSHLVSGGVDFSVCLWNIYAGTLLHRFCIHAGEVTQLLVPPVNCNSRVLQSICSVASDHSVALLALKDKKCIMLASRHLFPVEVVKWRPLDDFMIVGCCDGSVYVWQMETGHLDRVVQGLLAEDILKACDEHVVSSGDRMTNPAVHLLRGLRHRNMAAIRLAAQRGLHQLHQGPMHMVNSHAMDGPTEVQRSRAHPLMVQGLRTNPKDQDSHVLFFDIEALVVQLLSEEYASLSPGQLECQGLINPSEHQKYLALSSSPETQRKLSGIIAKMKDTAENAAMKIQATAGSVGFKTTSGEVTIGRKDSGNGAGSSEAINKKVRQMTLAETNLTMEIAQLLLSLLHAWGLDTELDCVCENKLGLLRPMRPVCFGLLSRGGYMSLLLPTFLNTMRSNVNVDLSNTKSQISNGKHVRVMPPAIPQELIIEEERARKFSSCGHWEVSTAITTTHLLAIIALANTLMSMSNATFIPEQERRRKLHRKLSRADSRVTNSQPTSPGTPVGNDTKKEEAMIAAEAGAFSSQQAQIKQGWSLLAALHCILLPDLVKTPYFMCPQVEMLARRWQDRCLEVREAAQALLLAELRRIGSKGRKQIVEEWAPYLPNYGEPPYPGNLASHYNTVGNVSNSMPSNPPNVNPSSGMSSPAFASVPSENVQHTQQTKEEEHISEEEEEEEGEHVLEESSIKPSSATEGKRKQATAIVLLGVIGAEYGHEIEISKRRTPEDQKRKSVVDGFGLANYSLARHTSQALAFLLLAPPSAALPAHTSLRRAAIDLIGRGITVWEPYLDVSKVLLGLLKLCCDSDKLVPSMSFGLPLTPAADSCRTARHALSLIATARPSAFITKLAREVRRYNTVAQNAQALNISMNMTILSQSKPEILRIVELLIDKMQADVSDLLVDVMDIVVHCLDHTQLKARGLKETFPAICRFNNVSYCTSTRRIAVGSKDGKLAMYELKASKSQTIYAHAEAITACAFSPDGKFLASYSNQENKLCFWQTATGMFGLGNAQTRCVRTYNTPALKDAVKNNPLKMARLQWTTNKVVILLIGDGSEHKFSVS